MSLKKDLGLIEVFSIATGAMISSGLFILPGLAFSKAGPAMILAYVLAGVMALLGMLSQAELVSAMPKSGGTYFYVTRSLGPAAGTVNGLITWFSLCMKSAFALVGMAAFTKALIPLPPVYLALFFTAVFILTNILGSKEAGKIQVYMVFAMLGIIVFYCVRSIPYIEIERVQDFAPNGLSVLFGLSGYVFVSYGGLLKVASIAEEVKNPHKTIPLGMLLSLVVVMFIYILSIFITETILDSSVLRTSNTPISDGASIFGGQGSVILVTIAAILAFITTANAGIMAASRIPFALAKDQLLPKAFGKINMRFKTPVIAIIATGFLMAISLFFKLDLLVKVASTVLILSYLFSCLSVIIMRESRLQNYHPRFKSPFYPYVQIVGILGYLALIIAMGTDALLAFVVLVVVSLLVYWFYGRIRTTREFALLHLLQRITAKEFTNRDLETELKEIVRERDEIVADRFDELVESSVAIDLEESEEPLQYEQVFQRVAKALSDSLHESEDVLYQNLLTRERESSTAISSHVAIPHIVVNGEKKFELVVLRSKQGIYFNEESPKVNTIFVLAGSKDERNFHLRSLSAIAQLVQIPGFIEDWMKSKNEHDLKDVLHLSKRQR